MPVGGARFLVVVLEYSTSYRIKKNVIDCFYVPLLNGHVILQKNVYENALLSIHLQNFFG